MTYQNFLFKSAQKKEVKHLVDLITNEDERGEVQYIILTDESSTTFNKKDIKKVSVNATINQVYNYSIDIELTGGVVITLYLG